MKKSKKENISKLLGKPGYVGGIGLRGPQGKTRIFSLTRLQYVYFWMIGPPGPPGRKGERGQQGYTEKGDRGNDGHPGNRGDPGSKKDGLFFY